MAAMQGLGDTGDGWADIGSQLSLPHVKFLFPTSAVRSITLNGGMKMTGARAGWRRESRMRIASC
jgi:hypothetical protein